MARNAEHSITLTGDPFVHYVIFETGQGDILHIYLEGDGRPWLAGNRVAVDPTPSHPLMPDLMAADTSPALFIGRPCYFRVKDPLCEPRLWTRDRYSETVVQSIDAIINIYAGQYAEIVLMGHSGGGTLAMLIAARRHDVVAVITLAGNLDTQKWAQLHHYDELSGSLNPASGKPLPSTIFQRHYLGTRDRTITEEMIDHVVRQQENAKLVLLPNVDHYCCWANVWRGILEEANLSIKARNEHRP